MLQLMIYKNIKQISTYGQYLRTEIRHNDLYEKYVFETVGIKAVKLPSTSPANARWNLEKLETAYSGNAEIYSG